jgi:phosphatidylinositol dimannoside acyltransferase
VIELGGLNADALRERVSGAALATGWAAVRRLPHAAVGPVFNGLADQSWIRHTGSVEQLERNLRRVLPDASSRHLREVSRDAVRSYMRYWSEVFRLPDYSPERILSTVRLQGEEHIEAALSSGDGFVIALPHMANWDLAGAWLALAHTPFTTVAERLKPESLYERFLAYRRSLGMRVVPLTGEPGEQSPFRTLLQVARAGGAICLLGDRDLTAGGVEVDFFGEPARMPSGPAALTLGTKVRFLPATLWYAGDHLYVRIHPELPAPEHGTRSEKVVAMTQACADIFAGGIAEHPTDWHMMQPLWLADLRERS